MTVVCVISQAVAQDAGESMRVRLGGVARPAQVQLYGFKSRALLATAASTNATRRWLYEMEWLRVRYELPRAVPSSSEVLVIGGGPSSSKQLDAVEVKRWHAILFTLFSNGPASDLTELRVIDATLSIVQMQATLSSPPSVWICTPNSQPCSDVSKFMNAGLWGLARACRQELPELPAWCVDVSSYSQLDHMNAMVQRPSLQLPDGSVRGLYLSASIEPESAFIVDALYVPRLAAPYDVQSTSLAVEFAEVRHSLDSHSSQVMARLDMDLLLRGHELLETLCQQVTLPVSSFHHVCLTD